MHHYLKKLKVLYCTVNANSLAEVWDMEVSLEFLIKEIQGIIQGIYVNKANRFLLSRNN